MADADPARPSLAEIARLWRASDGLVGGSVPRVLARRLRFLREALAAWPQAKRLLDRGPDELAGRTIRDRPHLLALFTAPYLSACWTPAERIDRLLDHLAELERTPPLDFPISHSLELIDLDEIGPGYHVVLDKPEWFHREGVVVLNLFDDNVRLFSLPFALERREEGLVAMIGGIQGRKLPDILDTYREMTKLAHGIRPRDLLIELLRMLARDLGVVAIEAVGDRCRHHRAPFFGLAVDRPLPLDYDEVWVQRGGVRLDDCFFAVPVARQPRDEAEIPAKKRAMYRNRYELLDRLEARMSGALAHATAVRRPEAD